jgi:hypothetical protein
MDYANKEVNVAEKANSECTENRFTSLTDFQLALVGGGVGEVVFG